LANARARVAAQILLHCRLLHRLAHAGEPQIALGFADGNGRWRARKKRLTDLLQVQRRSAEPAGKKQVQLFGRARQVLRMQLADGVILGCVSMSW